VLSIPYEGATRRIKIYYVDFGFQALRHEGVTEYSGDPPQAQNVTGHADMDMTDHHTLKDWERQEQMIREFQERLMGQTEGSVQCGCLTLTRD